MQSPKLIHFTECGPWHGGLDQDYIGYWQAELESLLCGANPCARGMMDVTPEKFSFEVTYEPTK